MKSKLSISTMMVAVALLAFSFPLPAFSEMKDMSMKGCGEGHGQMMGMEQQMGRMGCKEGHGQMMGIGHMDMMGKCIENADKIGLTDDQIQKMKSMHREMQKKQVRFNADLKIAEIELMEIMEVKDFDLEKASSAINRITERKSAHHLEMLKNMKEIRTGLTDEQFKKMKMVMSMKPDKKMHTKKMMMK